MSLVGLFIVVMPSFIPAYEKTCIQIDHHTFQVEVAQTAKQKARGLQFRTQLNQDGGMIFPYEKPKPLTFWMKDCKIPLDLLFFNQGILVDFVDAAPPCNTSDPTACPLYKAKKDADLVVELKAGSRQKYHFSPQSRLEFCTEQPKLP